MFRRVFLVLILLAPVSNVLAEQPTIAIGSRLELFVDDYLIDAMDGDLQTFIHEPTPKDVVLVTGESWEGNTCAYYSIFRDGDIYRMYYRGSHANEKLKGVHPEVTCYAESRDGVNWVKPNLGIHEWNGSKENNIILKGLGTHCFVAFRDANPACRPDAKYKGISRGRVNGKSGLFVFQSPDGVHWKLIKDEPVITKGAFDSQNLAFWDPHTKKYVDYHRIFVNGVRAIMTCESDDFVNWTEPKLLKYPGSPNWHLYTNAVRPYDRAPHIRLGFPTRYIPQGSRVEPVFMASRDGVTFKIYDKPVIPRTAPKDRNGNRSNYMANGLVQLPGDEKHLSVYGTEAYYAGPDSRLRRFEYRVDGFASIRAGAKGGVMTTKPFTYDGGRLVVNYDASQGGSILFELLDAKGEAIRGFTRSDCQPLAGDDVAADVEWAGKNVKAWSGKTVRLRVHAKNADLYSIQFRD